MVIELLLKQSWQSGYKIVAAYHLLPVFTYCCFLHNPFKGLYSKLIISELLSFEKNSGYPLPNFLEETAPVF